MLLELFFTQPMVGLAWAVAIIFALTFHEYAHAQVGAWRGDKTAEHLGRLTLNPLAHLDPVGTIMLIALGFGWAKPVPFDPRNLQNPAWDGAAIALAGPFSNLILATLGAVAYRNLAEMSFAEGSLLPLFLVLLVFTNLLLLFFNLLPIPPLDGSKLLDAILYSSGSDRLREWLFRYGPNILLGLVIISLLTQINVFFFIQGPAIFACDQMIGDSCFGVLSQSLGG